MGTPPPALVFWAELLGIEARDEIRLRAIAPHGTVFAEHTRTLEKRQVRRFEYAGMKRRGGSCPPRRYRGEVPFARKNDGRTLHIMTSRALEVRRSAAPESPSR